MHKILSAMLVVFLLGAYSIMITGCGGGGSSGPAAPPPPEPMVHDVTLPTGVTATAGMETIAAGARETIGDITFTCPAGGEACEVAVTVADDGTVTAKSTGGMATAAESDASIAARKAAAAAMAVAATKAAATKTKAIKTENDQTTDAGLGGTARTDDGTSGDGDTSNDVYGLAISRDRDGTEIKITDPNAAGDDDPKFMQAMDLGGGRTMHTRTMEADNDGNVVVETVIVTTDIAAPKATAFGKVPGQTLDVDLAPTVDGPDEGTAPNDELTALGLTLVATGEANLPKVMASAFDPESGVPTKTFAFDDTATTGTDEAFETSGTYNGAPGTYRCNGAAVCTVTYAADKISGMTGTWVFIPDAGATSDVPDSEYLHYGVWLKKTTDGDGVVTYNEVETFAGVTGEARTDDSAIAADGAIRGTATYEGGATGVYVHQMLNPAGNIDSATSGHFTADVALTAYFEDTSDADQGGAGQIAGNLQNTISGTINNFMLSGHDEGPGWSVSLEKEAIDGAGDAPHVDGTAKGGGADGKYQATFYGGAATGNVQPTSVVGEFNAFFNNGSVAGGFGATKDD